MTTKEKIDIDIIRIRILKDFERKFLECREIWFEKVLDWILRKHLQEPTEEREVEIKQREWENLYWKYKYWNCICWKYTLWEFDKYCPRCWAKIKRID